MDFNSILKKVLNKETILYIIFGVVTTVVDFVVFSLFYYSIGFDEIVSNTIAWAVAVAVAFVTNKIFVFEKKGHELKALIREIVAFVGARVFSLILTDIFLKLAGMIDMNMLLAKALISVLVIVLNYFFSKLFIFKK